MWDSQDGWTKQYLALNISFEQDAHFAARHSHLSSWALACIKTNFDEQDNERT